MGKGSVNEHWAWPGIRKGSDGKPVQVIRVYDLAGGEIGNFEPESGRIYVRGGRELPDDVLRERRELIVRTVHASGRLKA